MTTPRRAYLYATQVRVLKILLDGEPRSRHMVAEAVPCSVDAADDAIRFWRAQGLVRVARWQRIKGPATPFFTFGSAPDAEVPAPRSSAERSRAWRAKGGDGHRARTLARQAQQIAQGATLAGLLKINHRRTSTSKGAAGRGKTTAPVTPCEVSHADA